MKHGRIDKTQGEIVQTFRKMGCPTFITSDLGKGFPDCLTKIGKDIWLIEIKDGSKPLSQRKLTPLEQKFHIEFDGCVKVISSVDEAIEFVAKCRI